MHHHRNIVRDFCGYPMDMHLDDKTLGLWWKISQFQFSVSLAIATYSRSYFCLPFLVAGLWKFGCPELLGYIQSAKLHWMRGDYWSFASSWINAMGTISHHSFTTIHICGTVNGNFPLTRDIIAVTSPLVLQHTVVLIKYVHHELYLALVLSIEAWWEWEIYSALELCDIEMYGYVGRTICLGMLFAHYCYLIAGGLSLIGNHIQDSSQLESKLDSNEESATSVVLKCDDITSTLNSSNGNHMIIKRNSDVNLDASRHSTHSKQTDDLSKSQHRLRMPRNKASFNDSENIFKEGGEVIVVKKNNSASNWKTELIAMEIFKEKEVAKETRTPQLKRRQSYVL